MAVRVVADAALAQPDRLRRRRATRRTGARSRRACRPGLRTCTSLSSHSSVTSSRPRPFTSMPPPSSTTRSPGRRASARCAGRPVTRGDRAADPGVERVVLVLRPAVEPPVEQHDAARIVEHARRRRVAQPDAVGGNVVQAHAVHANAVRVQRDRARLLARPRRGRGFRAARAPQSRGRSRRRPRESARACRASRARGAAS